MRTRAIVVAALAALSVIVGAGPAAAHARLISTSPGVGATVSPALRDVTLTFDDTIGLLPRALVVTGATGAPLPTGAPRVVGRRRLQVALLDRLVPGRYFVGWRVLSDDGHVVSGSFGFGVTAAGASAPLPAAVAPAALPTAPAQPTWPVVVAAGLAVIAMAGAAVVVRRGLRAVGAAAPAYPDDGTSDHVTTRHDRGQLRH